MAKLKKGFEDFQPWVFMRTGLILISQQSCLQRSSGIYKDGVVQGVRRWEAGTLSSCRKLLAMSEMLTGRAVAHGLPASTKTAALSLQVCCRKVKPMDWSNPYNIKSPSLAVSDGEGPIRQHRNLLRYLWLSFSHQPLQCVPCSFLVVSGGWFVISSFCFW